MTSNSRPREERAVSPNRDGALALMLSMADTTWRMFTPPALFVAVGIFTDLKLHTKPWVTILAAVAGLACSVLLVKKQLETVK